MRVYELMEKLSKLPAGAEVKTSIYVEERMDLFRDINELSLCARIVEVGMEDVKGMVYLNTDDVEV